MCGDYEISYTVELQNGSPYAGEMTVSEGTGEGTVVFNVPFLNGGYTLVWNIVGTLDAETGVITISKNQETGFNGAVFDIQHWDYASGGWQSVDEITAEYTGDAIVFDEDDALGLLSTAGGYYTLFDMIVMTKIIDDPNADPNEGWTPVGKAKLTDPWVAPAFAEAGETYTWEVELQRSDADANLYRLVDPYKGEFPFASYNESTSKHGYIQFNVSDPDHVTFDIVEAGFANTSMGVSKFYCYNYLSLFVGMMADYGMSAAEIVEVMGDDMPYTTFKDGVITLGAFNTTDEQGNPVTEYDAMFGIQGDKLAGYTWQEAVMTGKIELPADMPQYDPNKDWTSLGNAELTDPWVAPCFSAEPLTWEVELQQNKNDENVYRLVDPYKGNSPMAAYNESTKTGYIMFNVSDPDHVTFDVVGAGFANSDLGLSEMYCYNLLTMYSLYTGLDAASVVAALGDMIPYTTFKDGTVTLSYVDMVIDDETGETVPAYDACFGVPGEIDGGYSWTDDEGLQVPSPGKIVFPGQSGLTNVSVSNENAPVEYYNLQGVRVTKPAAGQLLIKRQGNTAAKIYVR